MFNIFVHNTQRTVSKINKQTHDYILIIILFNNYDIKQSVNKTQTK